MPKNKCSNMLLAVAFLLVITATANAAATNGVLNNLAMLESGISANHLEAAVSEGNLRRRRLAAAAAAAAAASTKTNDETKMKKAATTSAASTADLVARAKEDAKKKIAAASSATTAAAVSDKDKKKSEPTAAKQESTATDDKKKKTDAKKVPQFSVHKKPISSASLTKVADSVTKAAALEKEKEAKEAEKEKATLKVVGAEKKEAEEKKQKMATSSVTKTTADGKAKELKVESAHTTAVGDAKKDTVKPKDKTPDATKADDKKADVSNTVDTKKVVEPKKIDGEAKAKDTERKPTASSVPVKSDAALPKTQTTSNAVAPAIPPKSDTSTADHAKKDETKPQLPKPAKPNSIKEVDKYKERLQKTREELLKKNPKLKSKIEAKKKKAAEDKQKAKGGDETKESTNPAADTSAGGKDKLAEMAKQMKKKQALAKLKDVLRRRKDKDDAKAKEMDAKKADGKKKTGGKADKKDPHQRRSRPLRPGERVFSKIPIVKRAYKKTPLEDAFSDATLSLVEGLKHGVFTDAVNPLEHRRKEGLRDWLALLSASLPPELALHSLINDLTANIDTVSQKKSNLLKVIKKHPIKERKWSADCSRTGKRSERGGFSCGFWKLLHIISVGLAEHRGGMDVGKHAIPPMKAADTLREYMALFFGCDICTRNFVSQYDQCAYHRCDRLAESAVDLPDEEWHEFALYLWEVHNGVSVSVYHEKADTTKGKGRDEISAIYPSMEQCFLCLKEDGIFDDEHLTRHLVETYWTGPGGDSKDEMLRSYERSLERPLFSNAILSLSLSMMILAAYVMKRRYIKRTGFHKKFDGPRTNGHSKSTKQWRRI